MLPNFFRFQPNQSGNFRSVVQTDNRNSCNFSGGLAGIGVKEAGGAKVGAGEKGGVGALEGGGGDGAGLLGGELGLDAEDADVGEEHEDEEVLSFFLRERAEDEEVSGEGPVGRPGVEYWNVNVLAQAQPS